MSKTTALYRQAFKTAYRYARIEARRLEEDEYCLLPGDQIEVANMATYALMVHESERSNDLSAAMLSRLEGALSHVIWWREIMPKTAYHRHVARHKRVECLDDEVRVSYVHPGLPG